MVTRLRNNLTSILFAILNIIFVVILFFKSEIILGIALFISTMLIIIRCTIKQAEKNLGNIRLINERDLLQDIFKQLPFKIRITSLRNEEIIFQNCEKMDINNNSNIIDSIEIKENEIRLVKIKDSQNTTSYFHFRRVNHDLQDIEISVELNMTNIFKWQIGDNKIDYYRAFNSSNDGILILKNEDGNLSYITSNMTLKTMLKRDSINESLEVFAKKDRERVSLILQNLNSKSTLFEAIMLQDDKEIFTEISAKMHRIDGKDIILLNIRDTNKRKMLENKRDRKRILATKYSINAFVLGFLQILFIKLGSHTNKTKESANIIQKLNSDFSDEIKNINQAQEAMISHIQSLIMLNMPSSIKSQVNVKSVLLALCESCFFKEMLNNIILTITQKGDVSEIYCDECEISFMFFIIIQNVIERINILKGTNYNARIDITIENVDANFISVAICDSVGGLSDEDLERMFDLFYAPINSKNVIGLAIAKIVVEECLFGNIKAINAKNEDGMKIAINISKG